MGHRQGGRGLIPPPDPGMKTSDACLLRRSLRAAAGCRLAGGVTPCAALSPHLLNNSHAT